MNSFFFVRIEHAQMIQANCKSSFLSSGKVEVKIIDVSLLFKFGRHNGYPSLPETIVIVCKLGKDFLTACFANKLLSSALQELLRKDKNYCNSPCTWALATLAMNRHPYSSHFLIAAYNRLKSLFEKKSCAYPIQMHSQMIEWL
jgi:hypothetical protein